MKAHKNYNAGEEVLINYNSESLYELFKNYGYKLLLIIFIFTYF